MVHLDSVHHRYTTRTIIQQYCCRSALVLLSSEQECCHSCNSVQHTPIVLLLPLLLSAQECFQAGVDTDCTPAAAEGSESFPLDASHGFNVAHDMVWDGSMEDPSTGLCQKGTPDPQGRFVRTPTLTYVFWLLLGRHVLKGLFDCRRAESASIALCFSWSVSRAVHDMVHVGYEGMNRSGSCVRA